MKSGKCDGVWKCKRYTENGRGSVTAETDVDEANVLEEQPRVQLSFRLLRCADRYSSRPRGRRRTELEDRRQRRTIADGDIITQNLIWLRGTTELHY